jgi:hypothetical protein
LQEDVECNWKHQKPHFQDWKYTKSGRRVHKMAWRCQQTHLFNKQDKKKKRLSTIFLRPLTKGAYALSRLTCSRLRVIAVFPGKPLFRSHAKPVVAHTQARAGTYFHQLLGEGSAAPAVLAKAQELRLPFSHAITYWTRPAAPASAGYDGYRVLPARKYAWLYKNSSGLAWALEAASNASCPIAQDFPLWLLLPLCGSSLASILDFVERSTAAAAAWRDQAMP